jgi:acetylornithine/N-succinyldiaminopimelate aminotransferase
MGAPSTHMQSNKSAIEAGKQVLIGNYGRLPVAMVRGSGSRLWDADGKQYIDLFAGFGAAILGHCHPALVAAAAEQAQALWHVGNTFWTLPQIDVAQRLNRLAFPGQSFFCQSGAEANEAACKLARLRGQVNGGNRYKIISLHKSFHGRTLAMLAATGSTKYREGFKPDVAGFVQVDGGDFDALAAAVDADTAGILMEPIQGEGGMNIYPADYAARVRRLCDEKGLTLIFDEVWTGCGRTGKWFGHQYFQDSSGNGVLPDVMTLGKAIGGGLPVGVMHARPEVAALLTPGKHGSTLGANGICMAVTRAILDTIERDNLLQHANTLGEHAVSRIKGNAKVAAHVADVRGRGLFLGLELKQAPKGLVEKGLEKGVVVNVTADKVVRIAPPINVSRQDLDEGLDRMFDAITSL